MWRQFADRNCQIIRQFRSPDFIGRMARSLTGGVPRRPCWPSCLARWLGLRCSTGGSALHAVNPPNLTDTEDGFDEDAFADAWHIRRNNRDLGKFVAGRDSGCGRWSRLPLMLFAILPGSRYAAACVPSLEDCSVGLFKKWAVRIA